MRGRQILDDILIPHECIEEVKRSKSAGMVPKVDPELAYDYVNWNFLDYALRQKGFGAGLRKWVIEKMGLMDAYFFL